MTDSMGNKCIYVARFPSVHLSVFMYIYVCIYVRRHAQVSMYVCMYAFMYVTQDE